MEGGDFDVLVNRTEIAEALKVSLPTVDALVRRGMPVEEVGSNGKAYAFHLGRCLEWYRTDKAAQAADKQRRTDLIRDATAQLDMMFGEDEETGDLNSRQRQDYYNAERARILVDQQRGRLCDVDAVQLAFERAMRFLADRLQSLPDHLEKRCGLGPEAVDQVVRAVDDWQDGLARELSEDRLDVERGDAA